MNDETKAAREAAIMEWLAGAADRDELRADCERRIAALREENRRITEDLADCGIRLGTAERAVIELRARVAELEDPESDAHHGLLLAAIKRGAVTSKSVLTGAENRVAELEAQVAAARAWAKTALDHHEVYGEDESGAYALLRAMDEAASKVKEH